MTNSDRITAEIITIGDEILIGQIVDTNSAYISAKLNEIGISVEQMTSIADKHTEITRALKEATNRVSVVITTGGLGPTTDDVTKTTLAKFFNSELVVSQPALENVKEIFARYNRPMLEVNTKQAEIPAVSTLLLNRQGTAPGMWFNLQGKVTISLPGVPHEMKHLMEQVLPRLQDAFELPFIYHYTLLTAGIGESFLASLLEVVELQMPPFIRLAYLPSLGQLRLRLSSTGKDKAYLVNETEKIVIQIRQAAGNFIIAEKDTTLVNALLEKLIEKKQTIALAESCTGGLMASLLTRIPGSSQAFVGSAVVYSNALKTQLLGVSSEVLEKKGAVSEEVALAMANGLLILSPESNVISVTGIAGPDGGSEEKPVGLIYIGYGNRRKLSVAKIQLGQERNANIERTASHAFLLLFRFLDETFENGSFNNQTVKHDG